ncbi:MAG TPA: ABC transporter substrate-binding protein [Quisquiliibacterium sp.]|nr:ABC transporter substrate-binding protein [Quisquiliibacterium sp.]HQP67289.1 ABC transporter substrate-binding protein [Quisquiliibacterium sp.]
MKLIRRIGVAALTAFGLATAAQAQPVKVGVIFPLSGGAGPQGQLLVKSMQTMATLINESGGVLGRPIQIEARDDESTPAVGVSRANELISAGVSVIIEGWNSPVTLAMQPVISRAGVLDITAISKADPILSGEGNPLAVRLNSSNSQDGAVIANYLANRLKAKRIAFMTQNDAYGNGAQASIEGELKKLNHAYEKVAEEKFPFTQADFRVALTNVRSANPDATVLINASEGLGMPALIRQARQARIPGQLVAAVGTMAPSVISVAGDAANGVVGADIYFPDVEPFASNPVNQRFVARMQEQHKHAPDKFMALGAAALQVWALAANELKTLDREAIAKRIRGGTFKNTILGDMSFAPNGQLASRHYVFTIQGQKMVVEK